MQIFEHVLNQQGKKNMVLEAAAGMAQDKEQQKREKARRRSINKKIKTLELKFARAIQQQKLEAVKDIKEQIQQLKSRL